MSVTNLAGTVWVWNETFAYYSMGYFSQYAIQFRAPNIGGGITVYEAIEIGSPNYDTPAMSYIDGGASVTDIIGDYAWNVPYSQAKDIEIIAGDDVKNAELISILEANATLVSSPDIVIEYNGDVISTMADSGSKTLETEGKYCTSDITVNYQKSGGGAQTVPVSIKWNDATELYYTDAEMVFHAITSGSTDLINVLMPLGSIVVCGRTGMAPPVPIEISGLTQRASYTVGSKGQARVYEVTG